MTKLYFRVTTCQVRLPQNQREEEIPCVTSLW
jgi:hypothetical protein